MKFIFSLLLIVILTFLALATTGKGGAAVTLVSLILFEGVFWFLYLKSRKRKKKSISAE